MANNGWIQFCISARRRAAAKKVRQLKEGTDGSDENNDDNDDDLLADMNMRKIIYCTYNVKQSKP